jgi:hypothetical protein
VSHATRPRRRPADRAGADHRALPRPPRRRARGQAPRLAGVTRPVARGPSRERVSSSHEPEGEHPGHGDHRGGMRGPAVRPG